MYVINYLKQTASKHHTIYIPNVSSENKSHNLLEMKHIVVILNILPICRSNY